MKPDLQSFSRSHARELAVNFENGETISAFQVLRVAEQYDQLLAASSRLLAERAELVAALRRTQEHLEARPLDRGLDMVRQVNANLLRRIEGAQS